MIGKIFLKRFNKEALTFDDPRERAIYRAGIAEGGINESMNEVLSAVIGGVVTVVGLTIYKYIINKQIQEMGIDGFLEYTESFYEGEDQ